MTYFEKNEQKHFFPMFSMLNAIGGISNVADFTTPCVNITNSAFSQLYKAKSIMRDTCIHDNAILRQWKMLLCLAIFYSSSHKSALLVHVLSLFHLNRIKMIAC